MRFRKPARPAAPTESLGVVETRSGELLLLDFGCSELWSGEASPVVEEGRFDPEVTASLNRGGDHEVVGPDAERAAGHLDLASVHGRYAFDVPGDAGVVRERLAVVCAEHGLQAELRPIERMPHRERVRRLLDRAPAGTEVPFHGMWGVAVRDVPAGRALPVRGVRMDPEGPDVGRWRSVWVEVAEGDVASSEAIGYVLVDRARLMFADPDALSSWNAGDPEEGLADLVFWGRDGDAVAAHLGAERFDEAGHTVHGWRDRSLDEVRRLGAALREHLAASSAKVATDYRPHDDDHRILSAMRESPSESATADVAGGRVCGFFTSWGDGAFPVYRDLGADGGLLRVRVELGAPEIVARARRMEELWFGSLAKLAIASPGVVRGDGVRWLERYAPRNEKDSGWCVYAGTETQEELDDPGSATLVPLRDLIKGQPDLEAVFATPAPAAFERADDGSWQPIPLPEEP